MIFKNLGWGMRLLKDFFTNNNMFVFFVPYYDFSAFLWIKKDAPWNSASIGPNESPWTPIFDHFVQFWIMSVPKQPGLILKSDFKALYNISTECYVVIVYHIPWKSCIMFWPGETHSRLNRLEWLFNKTNENNCPLAALTLCKYAAFQRFCVATNHYCGYCLIIFKVLYRFEKEPKQIGKLG